MVEFCQSGGVLIEFCVCVPFRAFGKTCSSNEVLYRCRDHQNRKKDLALYQKDQNETMNTTFYRQSTWIFLQTSLGWATTRQCVFLYFHHINEGRITVFHTPLDSSDPFPFCISVGPATHVRVVTNKVNNT